MSPCLAPGPGTRPCGRWPASEQTYTSPLVTTAARRDWPIAPVSSPRLPWHQPIRETGRKRCPWQPPGASGEQCGQVAGRPAGWRSATGIRGIHQQPRDAGCGGGLMSARRRARCASLSTRARAPVSRCWPNWRAGTATCSPATAAWLTPWGCRRRARDRPDSAVGHGLQERPGLAGGLDLPDQPRPQGRCIVTDHRDARGGLEQFPPGAGRDLAGGHRTAPAILSEIAQTCPAAALPSLLLPMWAGSRRGRVDPAATCALTAAMSRCPGRAPSGGLRATRGTSSHPAPQPRRDGRSG